MSTSSLHEFAVRGQPVFRTSSQPQTFRAGRRVSQKDKAARSKLSGSGVRSWKSLQFGSGGRIDAQGQLETFASFYILPNKKHVTAPPHSNPVGSLCRPLVATLLSA